MPRARLAACVLASAGLVAASDAPETGVKDTELGLSKTSVFVVPVPPPVESDTTAPGERSAAPAAFPGEPPRIPHGIADFGPITREDNPCLACHTGPASADAEPGEPPPPPASHFVDLRHAPERTRTTVAGARYLCTACHVSLTRAAPLVGNDFGTGGPAGVRKP